MIADAISTMALGLQGHRLREMRERAHMTQEELAAALETNHPQIWRWESGKNAPSVETLARIASLLNCTSDYLLGLVDDPSGLFSQEDLTPMERRLIDAMRRGEIATAFETLASLSKQGE